MKIVWINSFSIISKSYMKNIFFIYKVRCNNYMICFGFFGIIY